MKFRVTFTQSFVVDLDDDGYAENVSKSVVSDYLAGRPTEGVEAGLVNWDVRPWVGD